MEMMYQRNKIQEESLYYESLKHNGEFPVIGVNTFLSKEGSPTIIPEEVIRSSDSEKQAQIKALEEFHNRNVKDLEDRLRSLKSVSLSNGNIFQELMETSKKVSLGQMTHSLYEVGGQYRRSM